MLQNRYHETLRNYNKDILDLCPANQTMRVELAFEIKKILQYKPDLKVLEIGVGEGDLTKYILKHNPEIRLDCLDESPEMIESAKIELGEDNITYIQDDAYEYLDKIETPVYGIIVSARTIHNFTKKDQTRLFEKIFDKLQDGGVMIIMDKVYTDDEQANICLLEQQNARYRYLPKDHFKNTAEEAIVDHEMQDYDDNYRMEASKTIETLEKIGFRGIEILDRIERDVILVAKK